MCSLSVQFVRTNNKFGENLEPPYEIKNSSFSEVYDVGETNMYLNQGHYAKTEKNI